MTNTAVYLNRFTILPKLSTYISQLTNDDKWGEKKQDKKKKKN